MQSKNVYSGIILSILDSIEKLNEVLAQDPFKINSLVIYKILEFIPSMVSDEFVNLKK